MASQKEKADLFSSLHIKGDPLILFNIWDPGSAAAVAEAGAKAIATGSHSVAAANGYADGQKLPLDDAIANIRRIAAAVDLPVTLDFEGGYAESPPDLSVNIERVIDAGVIGINFEDQVVGGSGLYPAEEQVNRIRAIREAADRRSLPFFINARTDVFLKTLPSPATREQFEESVSRANAYAAAGASGFFAPGLRDPELIRELCEAVPLPVNIMVMPNMPTSRDLANLGVARVSYGPMPYRQMVEALKTAARSTFSE